MAPAVLTTLPMVQLASPAPDCIVVMIFSPSVEHSGDLLDVDAFLVAPQVVIERGKQAGVEGKVDGVQGPLRHRESGAGMADELRHSFDEAAAHAPDDDESDHAFNGHDDQARDEEGAKDAPAPVAGEGPAPAERGGDAGALDDGNRHRDDPHEHDDDAWHDQQEEADEVADRRQDRHGQRYT